MIHTYTKTQDQRSIGSKDRVETNGRTDRRTDMQTDDASCFFLPAWLTRSVINIRVGAKTCQHVTNNNIAMSPLAAANKCIHPPRALADKQKAIHSCVDMLRRPTQVPLKNAHFRGVLAPIFGPRQSVPQTASRSTRPLLHNIRMFPYDQHYYYYYYYY